MAREESADHEQDVVTLFLERVSYALGSAFTEGIVVVAKPSGGAKNEESFLARCLELIESGTEYQALDNLPVGVFTAHSRRIRLLQLADVITSCTVARIAGEHRHSEEVFALVKPLFRNSGDRVGGVGVKIHPDLVYGNLYHWLLGDSYIPRSGDRRALPDFSLPFAEHPNEPLVTATIIRAVRDPRKAR
jgi:hypothetical protein